MADNTLTAKLTVDSKGLMKGFKQAQEVLANMQEKTASFGKGLKDIGKSISGVGDTLSRQITTPALAATKALTGMTLVKGFNQLTGIDTAQAKLKALGLDAKSVEGIMNSALDSVRGTSFGMDEAATAASSAVAAGIKPGKELSRYLSLTGDAAAIAGTSMSEMGSILNKVQTSQKAYTGELNMLASTGIPIFQWLADEAGVSTDKIMEMASSGGISSEMFLNAIETNIGGAAKIMGDSSFSGSVANIGNSISRIGANFLDAGGKGGGFFSIIKPMLADFNNYLGVIEEKAAELGVKFGEAFSSFITKMLELKAKFDGLSPSMQGVILNSVGIGASILVGIGPALKIIGTLATGVGTLSTLFSFLFSPIGLIAGAIIGLGIAFGIAMANNEEFRNKVFDAFGQFATAIIPVVISAVSMLIPFIVQLGTTIMSIVMAVLPILLDLFIQLVPVVMSLVLTVIGLVSQLLPLVSVVLDALLPVILLLIDTISNIVTAVAPALIAIIGAVIAIFEAIIPVVISILTVVIQVIANIIAAIMPIIAFIAAIITTIISIIAPIVTYIASIISIIFSVITPIIYFVTGVFTTVFSIISEIWQGIMLYISNAIAKISEIIAKLSSIVSGVFNTISGIVSRVMGTVSSIISGVFSAIQGAWKGLTGIVSNIFSGISSSVEKLVGHVKGFINGVIGGINLAIGLINKIPGVNISNIPQLYHGTNDWIGGFAYMNEGGRGELALLPTGSQVIPHDVSMRYAREAGRMSGRQTLEYSGGNTGIEGITQHITINSPHPTSPSENARRMKQASRQLAMEWSG
ncbi:phage tail protein [Ornithinibacillus bavariensis]|uniref:Tape measure protein N-terminal domain-containing protein n=1 Tax=Ornithinibacillus bavariensis TaxID=545502 RepID=A0A919XBV1_9BACI|nr:tape measure protein [Ornithinibacillus bavariensis]GIO27723.1 hypothetical protein J43TS3_23340 [Ornithinibacillus bavariensis]